MSEKISLDSSVLGYINRQRYKHFPPLTVLLKAKSKHIYLCTNIYA